ncbi:hypothetical protein AVL62_07690 [Serinicoccus chungangensis]|uniref:Uncharacterized protein n=1 Tax=Serinicoccus chungangensis TaxID=767452 RepID=A0A0W8I262_9MICO|nr:hypothetical protein [Serinicoccus chungangensis]KUG51820.1 hypothetical protein AVL62_07690 [Serinicoccus chungangensis]
MSEDTSKVSVVPGEWSGDVAGVAATAGVVAAVVSTWIFTRAAARIELTEAAGVVEDSSWVDGSFAQRAAVLVVLLALWVASLAIIAAGVLAVIETRAVLKKPVEGRSAAEVEIHGSTVGRRSLAAETVKAASVLVEKLTRARGTVVLGVAGMVIGIAALASMVSVLSGDGGGSVVDGAGQTATPTPQDGSGQTQAPVAPGDGSTATTGTSGGDE